MSQVLPERSMLLLLLPLKLVAAGVGRRTVIDAPKVESSTIGNR